MLKSSMMFRLTALLTFFLILMMAGCAKKPAPEPVPEPMTEAYLLSHMQTTYDAKAGIVVIKPLSFTSSAPFHDANATLRTSLFAEVTVDPTLHPTPEIPARYRLFFSMRANAWGGFTRAIDTLGLTHKVIPYTSYIRQGIFYDNCYVDLTRDWLLQVSKENTEIILLGPQGEVAITLPAVYPAALLRYVDEARYREANTGTSKKQ